MVPPPGPGLAARGSTASVPTAVPAGRWVCQRHGGRLGGSTCGSDIFHTGDAGSLEVAFADDVATPVASGVALAVSRAVSRAVAAAVAADVTADVTADVAAAGPAAAPAERPRRAGAAVRTPDRGAAGALLVGPLPHGAVSPAVLAAPGGVLQALVAAALAAALPPGLAAALPEPGPVGAAAALDRARGQQRQRHAQDPLERGRGEAEGPRAADRVPVLRAAPRLPRELPARHLPEAQRGRQGQRLLQEGQRPRQRAAEVRGLPRHRDLLRLYRDWSPGPLEAAERTGDPRLRPAQHVWPSQEHGAVGLQQRGG
mmetsp:Transcript_29785/g.85271  ORF Transcript_29785/g.85271 Transcript_29785/m.85271 type:complete len:314 (+) Transcript_29785:594-1535(+)